MVAFETFTNAETRLVGTGGTIKVGVTPKSAFAADTTSSLGVSLGRDTREDKRKMPLIQPAHCICVGKLGKSTVWKQKGSDDLFLEFKEGSSPS